MKRFRFALTLGLLAALPIPALSAEPGTVTISGPRGSHDFKVEIVSTPAEIEIGLMFRNQLAPGTGMLFKFKELDFHNFWMKNTLIPLDIIFINDEGTIRYIRHRAVPRSEALIVPPEPILNVLELPGGTAGQLGIVEGDTVTINSTAAP